jgi:Flp pilus assembly protein TadG
MISADVMNPDRLHSRGQVLPLFALFLIVLLGFAALAIDVSGALSARRFYRSAADAASLAGAQDLQVGTGRAVDSTHRTQARTDAMARLVSLLGASSTPAAGTCDPANQISDCALPGTPFHVWITTPSPSCVTCDPNRSLQVTIQNPAYGLAFARVFSQATWNVASTSIAGLTYAKSYTIVTLRPPKKLGSTFDVTDITLDGGTVVNVSIGDVGTNANMNYSGTGSLLVLNPDYGMYYFDPNNGPMWGTNPPGIKITELIQDPNYQYPSMTGAPTWADARESQANTAGSPATTAAGNAACSAEWDKVDKARYAAIATTPLANVYCFEPGIYDGTTRAQLVSSTGNVALLKPGAYYLKKGADISGSLLGGYAPGVPGVALMFDECYTAACTFNGNNAYVTALNAGTKFPPTYSGGVPATAALDWSGAKVQTSGPASPAPPLPLTILVIKDPTCYVPAPPQLLIEPSGCDANHNVTVNVAGSAGLVLEGVQYMPSDNATITGSSSSVGRIGQIIAWTLKYSGGVAINQEGADNGGPGILRLDAACTAPSTVCNSP